MSKAEGKAVSLKELVNESVLFGLGGMADRLIGFVFLPLTASILASTGFGVYSLYSTTSQILVVLCSVAMQQTFFRFYTEPGETERQIKVLHVAFTVINVTTLSWIPFALLGAGPVSRTVFGVDEPLLVWLMALRSYAEIVGTLADCRLQAEGQVVRFVKIRMGGALIVRALGLGLLIYYRTPLALAAGEAVGMAITTAWISFYALRGARLRFHPGLTREMVHYGVGMVPGFLSAWLLVGANRYLLKGLASSPLAQVGIYSVAERFSSIMTLFATAFGMGWRRFAFQNIHIAEGPRLLARATTLYFLALGYCAVGLALSSIEAIRWLLPAEYTLAMGIAPGLCLAAFVVGLAGPLRIGLVQAKSTLLLSWLTIVGAVVNIVIAVATIPAYGVVGATLATVVGQITLAVLTLRYGQKVYHVPFEYGRTGLLTAWYLAAYVAGVAFEPLGPVGALGGKVLVLALLPFLLYWFGPLDASEREAVGAMRRKAAALIGPYLPTRS